MTCSITPWNSSREFKGDYKIYYHNAGGYWIKTFDFKPYYHSLVDPNKKHTTISELSLPKEGLAVVYLSLLNSSLYYFFWKSHTDARHIYPSDIALFHIDLHFSSDFIGTLRNINDNLMEEYKLNSERITYGKAIVDEYNIAPCKPILDLIDREFAKLYGFTEEELDFIINYDIKYRMGKNIS